jgi:ATP-dependent DNA ligase
MPGMKEISPSEANKINACLFEVKVDGTRMSFNGQDIISDRGVIRNDRFPHIVKELRKLRWKVRGEIALPHGNVLQINKKENWAKALFYTFDMFEHNGNDLRHLQPDETRDRIAHALKQIASPIIGMPRSFNDFGDAWNYANTQKAKGNYVEGVVIKPYNSNPYKIKLLTEKKYEIVGFEAGAVKGAFLIDCNGIIGKVSGTSVAYVQKYHDMIAKGLIPYVEIEYQFLTDNGIPFQPRLRQLDTLKNLKLGG